MTATWQSVTYISGDTWNVNPIALKRIERLFCKNERAAIRTTLSRTGHHLTMVPVAAILVASIRLNFLGACADVRVRRSAKRSAGCGAGKGCGNGLVSARIDNHRVGAGRLHPDAERPTRLQNPGG